MTRRRIFVPRDAGALALGSDEVERAIVSAARRRGTDVEIVRTGSRGLFWLEPMIEIETSHGRIAYGPVKPEDVEPLFAIGWLDGRPDELHLGRPEDIPFLKRQTRFTFAGCGIVDRLSLADYRAQGGMRGLERALSLGPSAIVEEVIKSGLRGRGGAGFPTGIKWKTTADAGAAQKYIVCNADEGDSGTYADRMLMEGDPFCLIEGMAIAAIAVGATKGFVYIRSEYPHAIETFGRALAIARDEDILGAAIAGSSCDFDIEIRVGAGAYVCGEETALLDSLEGKRGQVRAKPPLPAHKGAFGQPTVVNNVISLASVPAILADGADAKGNASGSGSIAPDGCVLNALIKCFLIYLLYFISMAAGPSEKGADTRLQPLPPRCRDAMLRRESAWRRTCGGMDRRVFLSAATAVAAAPSAAWAVPAVPGRRRLNLVNAHTGETFNGPYRDDDGPIASALKDLSWLLRDFRCGQEITIDLRVLDFLASVLEAVGDPRVTILSAYRTPATNEMLARTNFGVAEHSQHLYGRALDIYIPSRLEDAMAAARAMQRGGVGWYPNSRFIHLDAGPVRNWTLAGRGLGRLLLDGKASEYYPEPLGVSAKGEFFSRRSGRPVTPTDRLAIHNLLQRALRLPGS